jgi:predicted nucleotidyltransferase
MKATKEHILDYLHELKGELHQEGIIQLGLFGSSYARGENTLYS